MPGLIPVNNSSRGTAADRFEAVALGSRVLYIPGQPSSEHRTEPIDPGPVRSNDGAHRDAPGGAQPVTNPARRPMRAWPVLLLALPAFVAIWSGWVGLGQLTGFGPVRPLPGILDQFTLNTAITLPIGMETYASYALYVWLSGRIRSDRTRSYAKYSAIGSLILGATGQVAYHLMRAANITAAPWPVTVLVACLPVAVLGMGAALAHMIIREHHDQTSNAPTVRTTQSVVRSSDDEPAAAVREVHTESGPAAAELISRHPMQQIEAAPQGATGAQDRWAEIAEALAEADPSGRRDIGKVTTILRLKFEHNWPHARIADHVELSKSAVTRTITAAREHIGIREGGTGHGQ
ncbi:hypothetical protein [Nocardia wallacei]|uniref:hypothetical protein n=1 Tax=Nocardia wallacei TaxID=480035 RepID=UPI002455EA39|nr:hypothetical protein [Nocardia wallacei]